MRARVLLELGRQSFPKVRGRSWIVEDIARAQNRMHSVPAGNIEDAGDNVHTCS